MAGNRGALWAWFWKGKKQNSSHYKAYCYACIANWQPNNGTAMVIDNTEDGRQYLKLPEQAWFEKAHSFFTSRDETEPVRGEKSAMASHLKKCSHACKAAKKAGKKAQKKDDNGTDADDESNEPGPPSKKRKAIFNKVEKLVQTPLKVHKGISVPFSEEQKDEIQKQFLRATISANLPFCWTENPEVIKLFIMFRSKATSVMPARQAIAGTLLDAASREVEEDLKEKMSGKYAVIAYVLFPFAIILIYS
ncbi:hypothetical protein C8J56DRAFT_789675 [Mycena floridula]|nr:hypothetical protein C8J56DRAFT_789675 [Mycena floridula]